MKNLVHLFRLNIYFYSRIRTTLSHGITLAGAGAWLHVLSPRHISPSRSYHILTYTKIVARPENCATNYAYLATRDMAMGKTLIRFPPSMYSVTVF